MKKSTPKNCDCLKLPATKEKPTPVQFGRPAGGVSKGAWTHTQKPIGKRKGK